MSAILKNDAIFFHTPRTGGAYLLSILEKFHLIQYTFKHFPHFCPDFIVTHDKTFRFGFIRHPWSWLHSYWNLKQRIGLCEYEELDIAIGLSSNFDHWIQLIYYNETPVVSNYQLRFVNGVEFVGKYESLQTDFITVLEYINPNIIDDVNKSWVYHSNPILHGSDDSYNIIMKYETPLLSILNIYG